MHLVEGTVSLNILNQNVTEVKQNSVWNPWSSFPCEIALIAKYENIADEEYSENYFKRM